MMTKVITFLVVISSFMTMFFIDTRWRWWLQIRHSTTREVLWFMIILKLFR